MITKLEEEFFKCFGIERKRNHKVTLEAISGGVRSANLSQEPFYEYPQITDHILLKLICILSRHTTIGHYTMDGLKRQLLNLAIIHKKDILEQVQAIFEV